MLDRLRFAFFRAIVSIMSCGRVIRPGWAGGRRWSGLVCVVAVAVGVAAVSQGAAAAATPPMAAAGVRAAGDAVPAAPVSRPLSGKVKASLAASARADAVPDLSKAEVVSARTQMSRTFLDPVRGVHVTQLSSQPVNYLDAKGAWQPIDNKLAADGSGGWKNGANSVAISLPGNLSKPVKVTDAQDASRWVSLQLAPAKTPVDALPPVAGRSAVVVPSVATTAGRVDTALAPLGNEIAYAKPLPGVDVSYAAAGETAKETVTLNSLADVDALPAASLTYTLRAAAGLSVAKTADGGLSVTGAKGAAVFTIPPSFMDDANAEHSAAVTTTLAADPSLTTAASSAWTVTLTPDHAWLAAPERVWPVVVDPTIGYPSAMKGCTIRSDMPTVNDCAGSEIPSSWSSSNERRTLVQFDTLLSVIPANAIMSVAYLNMYLPYASQGTTSNVDVRALKSAWTTSATWNKRDATNNWAAAGGDRTPTVYERYPFTASGAYQSAQVTKLVQNDLDGQIGDFGFILQKTSQDTTAITHFASPSSANPPNLYVEWDPRTGVRKGNTAIINEKLSDRTGVSINPATGNAAVSTKELTIAGMGVDLNVAHTSQSLDTSALGAQGYGWTSSLHGQRLTFYGGGTAANAETMFYTDGQGGQWTFLRNKNLDSTWGRPRGLNMDLVGINNGQYYQLTERQSQTVTQFKNIGDATNNVYGVDTITDRNGNKITFNYDSANRSSIDNTLLLRSVTDTRGRTLTVTNSAGAYDSNVTDSSSRNVIYTVNGSTGQLDQFTDAAGGLVKYEYDSGHRVTKVTTPSGQQTMMTYDGQGRILTLKNYKAADPSNSPLWQFAYTSFTRDSNNQPSTVTTVTDPNGHDTKNTANGRGLVTKTSNALGKDESKTYSPNDDVAQSTGRTAGTGGAETTKYTWEDASAGDTYRYVGSSLPTGASTSVDYTGQTGANLYNPKKSTDEQGKTSTYGYSSSGNKTSTLRADGKTEYTIYEGDTDPAYGGTVHCGPGGAATKKGAICEKRDAAYANGNSRASTPGHRTAYEYDSQGQLVTLHPPGSPGGAGTLHDQTFTYDSLSRLKTVTDGNGKTTTYTYDLMDRQTKVTHYDGTVEVNDFGGTNADGWPLSLKEYASATAPTPYRATTYGRDFMGRLTGIAAPEGTLGMGYDKASNLTSYTDNSGTTSYGYNNADQQTSVTMPGGSCSGLTYTAPGSNTASGCILFKLDDDGRRTGIMYPGGNLLEQNIRDDDGRIIELYAKSGGVSGIERLHLGYTYKDTGGTDRALIQSQADTTGGGTAKTTTYTYDNLNQLTKAQTTGGATSLEQFCYDYAGNRTYYYRGTAATCGSGSPAATDTFNSANELNGSTGATPAGTALNGGGSFGYDGNGAETSATSAIARTTSYSDRGQATSFTPSGQSAIAQTYSGSGNQNRVTSGTTTFMPSPLSPAPGPRPAPPPPGPSATPTGTSSPSGSAPPHHRRPAPYMRRSPTTSATCAP